MQKPKLNKILQKSWFLMDPLQKWPHRTEKTNWMANLVVGQKTNTLSFQDPVQFTFSLVLFTLVYDNNTVSSKVGVK